MKKNRLVQSLIIALAWGAVSAQAEPAPDNSELARRVQVLADEVERMKIGEAATTDETRRYGLGPSGSKVYRAKERHVSIGGYGEFLYENFEKKRDDGAAAGTSAVDRFDLVRAILFVGYRFSDRFVFNSEIEYEHGSTNLTTRAGGTGSGEVSVEFAYLDWMVRPEINFRAGLLLMPVGFLSELHEPTTWLGTRRPETETLLIPSTWRQNGIGIFGDLGSFTYRSYLTTSLDSTDFTSGGLRGGRQKGGYEKANDWSGVFRFDYVGIPGSMVGGSVVRGDTGNNQVGAPDVMMTLAEAHIDWKFRGFDFRALASRAWLGNVAELNTALAKTGTASVGSRMWGAYLQVGYDLSTVGLLPFTPYVRIEGVDTQDAMATGVRGGANRLNVWTAGLQYKPIDEIVLKADYQNYRRFDQSGVDQVNFALGYAF